MINNFKENANKAYKEYTEFKERYKEIGEIKKLKLKVGNAEDAYYIKADPKSNIAGLKF